VARVRIVFEGCRFTFYSDISASRVEEHLAELRKGIKLATAEVEARTEGKKKRRKPAIGAQTSNFYLGAIKSFCRWMVKDRRARENPVAHLDGLNVKLDRRHDRRNLTPGELSRLIMVATVGPVRHFMTGPARAMLYRVAMETGLRRKELRALTPSSFQLEGDELTVTVEAARSKNRKATLLPIRPELAGELRQWFQTAGTGPSDALWPNLTNHTAKMLKADLDAAGIAYVDAAGRFADFHALRHSFISMLAAGNVHPKLAQRLARHSDINLTMMRYSHTLLADEAQALDALPQFPSAFSGDGPDQQALRSTGTDVATVGVENVLPSGLPARARSHTFLCIAVRLREASKAHRRHQGKRLAVPRKP
jgi:integrase